MQLVKKAYAQITNPAIDPALGADSAAAADGSTFTTIFVAIWQFVITIGTLAVLLFFIWGAIEWIVAGGDASKIQKARDKIIQSVIGLIVLAGSFVIIEFISSQFFETSLGFDILNFTF